MFGLRQGAGGGGASYLTSTAGAKDCRSTSIPRSISTQVTWHRLRGAFVSLTVRFHEWKTTVGAVSFRVRYLVGQVFCNRSFTIHVFACIQCESLQFTTYERKLSNQTINNIALVHVAEGEWSGTHTYSVKHLPLYPQIFWYQHTSSLLRYSLTTFIQ